MKSLAFDYVSIPRELYVTAEQTGSSYICNPPVTTTDIDFVIFSDDIEKLGVWCERNGFQTNFGDYALEEFRSYKRGVINLIITADSTFYRRFVKATQLAKELNLLDKQQRVALFDFVMYESNIL